MVLVSNGTGIFPTVLAFGRLLGCWLFRLAFDFVCTYVCDVLFGNGKRAFCLSRHSLQAYVN